MATKRPRQSTLVERWGGSSAKKQALDVNEAVDSCGSESESELKAVIQSQNQHLPRLLYQQTVVQKPLFLTQ